MEKFDEYCYGCGIPLALDVDATAGPGDPCRYCRARVRYYARSEDRSALHQIADQYWSRADTVVDNDDVEGIPSGDADVGDSASGGGDLADSSGEAVDDSVPFDPWAAQEEFERNRTRSTAVVDGVPLHFALQFRYDPYLSQASREAPEPPGLRSSDERWSRYHSRIGKRYSELVKADLEDAAPSLEVLTNRREPGETGGPGIEFDVVQLVVGAAVLVSGYPGAKELVKDVRKLTERLRNRTRGPAQILDSGLAWLFAAEALAGRLAEIGLPPDMTVLTTSNLTKVVDYEATYGYLVHIRAADQMYIVAVNLDGSIASISSTDLPAIEPEEHDGEV